MTYLHCPFTEQQAYRLQYRLFSLFPSLTGKRIGYIWIVCPVQLLTVKLISYGMDCTHCSFVDSQSYRLYMNWFDCPVTEQQGYSCCMDCLHCLVIEQQARRLCMDCLQCPVTEQQGYRLLYTCISCYMDCLHCESRFIIIIMNT